MAKFEIDLSGRKGLAPQHQGNIDGSSVVPQYIYLGKEGQLADGTYNPFYRYGYMAPANDVYTDLTGTINNRITSVVFDEVNDDLYLGTDGPDILRLDGLQDTSLTTDTTIDSDRNILDMQLYEVADSRAIVYATDTADIGDSMAVGYKTLDSDGGLITFRLNVVSSGVDTYYEEISATTGLEIMAQRIHSDDISMTYPTVDKIRVRLSRVGAGTAYTVKVGLQKSDPVTGLPDGSYLASGTLASASLEQVTDENLDGYDVYFDMSSDITLTRGTYWLVVEPTDTADITGTNSFRWYRSDLNNSLYADGEAYTYDGASWSQADDTSESFDCALMLTHTDTWFPVLDSGKYQFTELDSVGTIDSMGSNGFLHAITLDSTHIIAAWEDNDSDGKVQVFTIDPDDGSLTAVGSAVEFELTQVLGVNLVLMDSSHVLIVWADSDTDGRAQVASISSYSLTLQGSSVEFEAGTFGQYNNASANWTTYIDGTHAGVTWKDASNNVVIRTLEMDGSWNVSALNSAVTIAAGDGAVIDQIDATHYLVCWEGSGSDGYASVYEVDGSYDWSETSAAALEFDTDNAETFDMQLIDSTHAIVTYQLSDTTNNRTIVATTLAIDGSYAVTVVDGPIEVYQGVGASYSSLTLMGETTYTYAVAMTGTGSDGYITTIDIDSTAYTITRSADLYEFDTDNAGNVRLLPVDEQSIYVAWTNSVDDKNYHQIFSFDKVYDDDNFYVEESQSSFLQPADNGLLYWFVGRRVHGIDGTITGGNTGTISKELLTFPSYMTTVDAVDHGGFMFIGIHANTNASGASDVRAFSTAPAGVYIWDRRSTVVGSRNYVPLKGIREIKRMFVTRNGNVIVQGMNNAKQIEMLMLSGSTFVPVQKLDKNGYAPYRHSVGYLGNMIAWQGNDGTIYSYGQSEFSEEEALYKIGGGPTASGTYTPGILHVSNDLSSGTPQLAGLLSWADDSTQKLSRWHINGTGTINTVDQTGHSGDIHTLVYDMPAPIHINYAHLFALPVSDDGSGNTTQIATLKVYYNKSTTASQTFNITRKDFQNGYMYLPLNRKNVVSVSFELEYDTSQVLGSYDLYPQRLVVEYNTELQSKK